MQTIELAGDQDEALTSPPGREQEPVGGQARPASEMPFGATKLLLDPLWNEGGSLVQQAQQMLRSMRGGAGGLSTGAPNRRSLTQRGPPLEVPLPFSGPGPVAGGASSGVGISSAGGAPLLAVIVCCFFAVLFVGLSRTYKAFLRPGTVPRLALERPG